MDSVKQPKSKLAKTFHKVIHLRKASKSFTTNGFCLLTTQDKIRCCESKRFEEQELKEEALDTKNKAILEAFVAQLFATISCVKAAYAELQMAQSPYNSEAIQAADQAVVDELKSLSELKHRFFKKQIDYSPPHVTLMLAEIQEQQSLMKTYEITMKKMQGEIESKESQIFALHDELNEAKQGNKSVEMKLNASGSFSILDNVKFSDFNIKDFIMVLQYALRSIRNFVKLMIKDMESANWDIEAAANSIQPDVIFFKKSHKGFAFESFICREIFSRFNESFFGLQNQEQRTLFFDEFKKLKSVNISHFLKQNPNSLFGKFLKSKYLNMVHPKMEFSFAGNLNQRKLVNSGEFPETEFFKAFAEMGRRVFLLHCLAFSFQQEVSIFQVKKNCRFSELYMETITDEVFTAPDSDLRVAFTVVPGFKVGTLVVQSQVYLSTTKSPVKHSQQIMY
ncbi:hypothetical protein Leryth_017890 [Lithospermum erythrorhizon]|uniref:DUF641 domain-containing protein n=1 Tax=Lithospermum erythrorhizon TaxID=34254 RepID=A0AAV3QWL2_LITER|nr:hypothetical protein Leryth_017890 [Lithospermum erythrorhizon]